MATMPASLLFQDEYAHQILAGIVQMFQLTICAWLVAMALGVLLAMLRMTHKRPLVALVVAYVEYHRNIPMLVQIFIWFFGIPTLLPQTVQVWINQQHSEFIFAVVAIALCSAAYISEDLRSGIRAIPSSQMEASRALGLTYLQAFRKVVLPQALRLALPPLVSNTVLLFKNTSLAMTIGVAELTYVTREIESQTFRTTDIYVVATVIYLSISLMIMAAGAGLQKRYRIQGR